MLEYPLQLYCNSFDVRFALNAVQNYTILGSASNIHHLKTLLPSLYCPLNGIYPCSEIVSLPKIAKMPKKVTPYNDSELGKKAQVTKMFDTISKNYDGLNRVISFGIDIKWRKRVVNILKRKQPKSILDIATGTGDLAINLMETGAQQIVGLDISPGMLEVGKKKVLEKKMHSTIDMVVGDSENLAYEDHSFEAVTVAFGVRNFETLEKGLSEIYRVLAKNGTFVVLETSVPTKTPYKQGYRLYTKYILPAIGRLFSKDRSAYAYLSESAAVFPHGEDFNNILRKIGFIEVENKPQTFGVASIYVATK